MVHFLRRPLRPVMRNLATPVLLMTVAIGTSTAVSAKEAKSPELTPTGETVSCLSPTQIRSTRVIDDQTIDFTMSNGTIYRNHLPYSCPGLKTEERFAYQLSTNQLCSVDIITVLRNFGSGLSQGPSCGLGKFQKMAKTDK